MMKKLIFILLFLCLLQSCKIIKYTSQQEFVTNSTIMAFTFENNQIIIPAKLDSLQYQLIFDTGAGGSVITNEEFLIGKNEKDAVNFGSVTLPNGDKLKNSFYPTDLCTSMFCYNSYLIRYIHNKKELCNQGQKTKEGLIGIDFIKELDRKQIYIDFNQQVILNLNKFEVDSIKENMILAKTEFFNKHFNIYLKIDVQEIPFIFDTGNSAFDLVVTKSFEGSQIPDKIYQGSMSSQIDIYKPISNYSFYHNTPCKNASIYDTINLVKISNFNKNNAGIGFIKRYNWFIDYEKEEVYFSPIEYDQQDGNAEWNDYFVYNDDNKLKIFLKNANATKYNIGDRIKRINYVEVTENNICELMKKLNDKGFDWDAANFVIFPQLK